MSSIAEVELQARDSVPLLHRRDARLVPSISRGSSGKAKVGDLESGSSASCRFCLESAVNGGDKLISPCLCKGTQQFVHRHCLDNWRSIREGFAFSNCTTCKARYHLRFVEVDHNKPWWNLKQKLLVARDAFLMFMVVQILIGVFGAFASIMDSDGNFWNVFNDTWEHLFSKHPIPVYYSAGVISIFLLAGIIGLIHWSWIVDPVNMDDFRNNCLGWILLECFIALTNNFIVLAVSFAIAFTMFGTIYGFFVITIAFHKSWQRHHGNLKKRSLTEEYIVEDLHGCYSAPQKMDQEHEERLRALKLL